MFKKKELRDKYELNPEGDTDRPALLLSNWCFL